MRARNILWLYSYPKTGSTWLRHVIAQILSPGTSSFEAIPSLQHDEPEVSHRFKIWNKSTVILKTHNLTSHQSIERYAGKSIGFISIYRHPLDVLLSSLNYSYIRGEGRIFKNGMLKSVDQIVEDGEMGYYLGQFIRHQGCRHYLKLCGSYNQYYKEWRDMNPELPHLLLRYEDAVADKAAAVRRISDFLGKKRTKYDNVVDSIESRTPVDSKCYWKKRSFNFRNYLSRKEVRKFEARCSGILDYFGYDQTF